MLVVSDGDGVTDALKVSMTALRYGFCMAEIFTINTFKSSPK
jgi:hypothetical protein